jgi:hypothetical protein
MKQFNAPWGKALWIVSVTVTALLIWVSGILSASSKAAPGHGILGRRLSVLPLMIIAGATPFTVRSYTISPDAILVQRLFWNTRVPLAGLQSARFDPDALRWSIRTCGNGGMYSITGWYWNRRLGAYRAFATDPKRAVVLKFARRTIVLTPDSPEDLVRELSAHIGKS